MQPELYSQTDVTTVHILKVDASPALFMQVNIVKKQGSGKGLRKRSKGV